MTTVELARPSAAATAAVEVRDLHKAYKLGQLAGLMRRAASALRGRPSAASSEFEALRGVSLDIHRGECLGIVGNNGSGKSTLMQIVSGITLPSAGEMIVRGRVLPLLGVGACFHPELTGRENVLLFGSILGLPRAVALERMDEIARFAEIERHLDTPNKRYSDGMQARLSFAVAMCFPADIYLFDEVLAVVDGEFRDRCLESMANMVKAGNTVVFISHQLEQVELLAHRVAWLDRGRLVAIGDTHQVLKDYRAHSEAHGREVDSQTASHRT